MDKSVIWLVVFLITAKVRGDSQVAESSTYLDGAITGFDPLFMSYLKLPNPGRRSKIFQPLYTLPYSYNKTVLNSFLDEVRDINNLPEIFIQKVINFQQYIDYTTFSGYKLSSDTNLGAPYLLYENYSSYETKRHQRDHAMFQFFKDTGGEVLFAKTDIVTHSITISPFEIPSFTPGFQRALATLYESALNPIPQAGNETFSEFVKIYGTHFSRRTLLGSRAIFGKLFSTCADTVEEEIARHRCVLEAARETLTPCMRGCNETMHTAFAKASSKCGGEEYELIVAVTGPLPERSLDDWASVAKDSPNPVFHELEPLSKLFNADWFPKVDEAINGSILSHYFEEHLYDYKSKMTSGGRNESPLRGCGLSSDCRHGTRCLNEPDTEAGFSCVPKEDTTTTSTKTTVPTTTTPGPTSTTTTPKRPTTTTTTTTTTSTCPGHVMFHAVYGQSKTIYSHPNFGTSNYDNSYRSIYTLVAPSGFRVRVMIQSFQTEDDVDILYVFENSFPLSTQLTTLSGNANLSTITSSGCSLFLHFSTDESITYSGFSLLYDAVL